MVNKLTDIAQKISPGFRQILTNVSWLALDRILQMISGLFVGVLIARYLGPEKFGIYNYAISFVAMISPLANMELESLVVRDIARQPNERYTILGTSLLLRLLGGFFASVLAIGLVIGIEPNNYLLHTLVAILSVGNLFQTSTVIDFWFQSQTQAKNIVIARRSAYFIAVILRVLLVYLKADLVAFAVVTLLETALGAIAIMISYRKNNGYLEKWKTSLLQAKLFLRECLPLIVAGLSVYVYSKIDQVMLGALVSDKTQLGAYSVAVKLSEIFDFIPAIIASSVLPKLTQIKGERKYLERMQIYFDVMLWLWIAVALPIFFVASPIVNLLYGNSYDLAGKLLSIYIIGQFGSNLGIARSCFLTIEGKLHYSLIFSVIGAGINIALNLFLIPKYQAYGATIATLITNFSIIICVNFLVRDLKPIGTFIVRSLNPYRSALRVSTLIQEFKK